MGEKGSLKNLYKSFRIFLAVQAKKKKDELLEKKKYKTSIKVKEKVKLSFFVVLTSIFGLIFSFLPSNKKEKLEIKEIKDDDDLLIVKNIVVNLVKTIEKSKDIDNINRCKNELIKIDKIVNKSNLTVPTVAVIKADVAKATIIADEKIEVIKEEKTNIVKQEKIEKINKELKVTKEKVNELKIKLPDITTKEELIDLKKEIELLEEKLKNNELKEEDIKKLDQFLLLYNTEEIRMLKAKVDEKLKIVIKKEEISIIPETAVGVLILSTVEKEKQTIEINNDINIKEKTEDKIKAKDKEKEKEKIHDKKEEIKEKIESSLSQDIRMVTSIVNKQLIGIEGKVNDVRKSFNNKPVFFIKIRTMVSNTLKLCASISPFFFFNNKVAGTFLSSVLLNNSIRSLRRSISYNKKDISYIRTNGLELLIKEHKEIEKRTKDIFDDSLDQIAIFKNDFINRYGFHINRNPELTMMMNEIYSIEDYIVSKQDEYKKENEQIKIKLKRY